jgi:hypothetical protein
MRTRLTCSVMTAAAVFCGALGLSLAPLAATGAMIWPVDASSPTATFSTCAPTQTINSTGMDANVLTHDEDYHNMWLTSVGGATAAIKYDLGGTTVLSGWYVWNYNQSSAKNRAIQTADVYISATGTGTPTSNPGEWTKINGSPVTLTAPPGNGNRVSMQLIALSAPRAARYVFIQSLSNYGDAGYTGLSEVRFEGSGGTLVPVQNGSFESCGGNNAVNQAYGWTATGVVYGHSDNGGSDPAPHLTFDVGVRQGAVLSQDIPATTVGVGTYKLSFSVADRTDTKWTNYRVEFLAVSGSNVETPIGSLDSATNQFMRPANGSSDYPGAGGSGVQGNWWNVSLTNSVGAALAGQNLRLRFTPTSVSNDSGVANDFLLDDVRMTFTAAPEGTVVSIR